MYHYFSKVILVLLALGVCINATCNKPQLVQTLKSQWTSNGQSFSQWEVKIINNGGNEALIGVSVTIDGIINQIWEMPATLNGRYELPAYKKATGIAPQQSHVFGYIGQSSDKLNIQVSGFYCPIPDTPTLFQATPLPALSAGVAGGNYPIGLLRQKGDFGLGAYEAMNGELVILDGVFYRALYDGTVEIADDTLRVPFASVTFFSPQSIYPLPSLITQSQLAVHIDSILPSFNYFYALKVKGSFIDVVTRVIPTLSEPYPPPLSVGQKLFFRQRDEATLVIIRSPKFTPNSNQGGSHFHYIADDKKFGGHSVNFTLVSGTIELMEIKNYELNFPDNALFRNVQLGN